MGTDASNALDEWRARYQLFVLREELAPDPSALLGEDVALVREFVESHLPALLARHIDASDAL